MKDEFGSGEAFFFTSAGTMICSCGKWLARIAPCPAATASRPDNVAVGRAADYRDVLGTFAQALEDQAEGMSSLVLAAVKYLERHEPFTAARQRSASERRCRRVKWHCAWCRCGRLGIAIWSCDWS